jgi:predicted transcriptional regulator
LYYGWMDLGQYRAYIDNLAKEWQQIVESEQFQSLLAWVQEKVKELYDKNIDEIEKEVENKIKEVWEEKAVEFIQEKYNKLTEADVKTIADEVTKDEEITSKG